MAAAIGVRGRFELLPCSGPGWLISLSALLSVVAQGALATTHWVVTEDGKIQQQVAARVPPLCPRPVRGSRSRAPVWLRAAPPPAWLPTVPAHGRGFLRSDLAPPPPLGSPCPGSAVGNFSAFHRGAARRPGTDPGELRLELRV